MAARQHKLGFRRKVETLKYSIIYADPPWDYEDKQACDSKRGAITYATMSLEDICRMPVRDLAADDALLFLWATMPKLPEALKVIDSWGFRYRSCAFVWVKVNRGGWGIYTGLGRWTHGNAELCLLAKRGHPHRFATGVKQIIMSPVREHSRKPEETRERIVRLAGDLPRIELFARQRVDGWDAWGNEVKSDILIGV